MLSKLLLSAKRRNEQQLLYVFHILNFKNEWKVDQLKLVVNLKLIRAWQRWHFSFNFFFWTVVHIRILSEGINELSLDTNYRVRFIHMFKMKSSLPTFRSVWILSNLCSCPLLLPGKQYLLMGKMTRMVGSTKVIAEVSRESYVEEWNGSLLRTMQDLRKRCQLMKTTQTTTLVRTEPQNIAGIALN